MRISSIYIDGFGIFHDESLSGLDSGLVLFQGNNESGKSTLLGFVRTILFGFPRANSQDPNYHPLSGGVHGGRIGLVTDAGEEFIIERKPGKGGGLITVNGPDGNSGGYELLQQLLGGVTYELFKNIYAFSLSELQTINTLKAESIRSVIYGAGAGTAMLALPRASKKINDRLNKLFRPGGRKPAINKKIIELEHIRSELRKASKQITGYEIECGKLRKTEEKIQAIRSDLVLISKNREKFKIYANLWTEWISLQEGETALCELEESIELQKISAFPENGIIRLEKELDTVYNHQEHFAGFADNLKQLRKQEEGLIVNKTLLRQAGATGFLLEKKNEYLEKLKALPLAKQEKISLNNEIHSLVDGLGKDWSEQTALDIDRSLFTRETIRKRKERLSRLKRKLAIADEIFADKKNQLENAVREKTLALKSIEQLDKPELEIDEQIITGLQHGRDEFIGAIRDIPGCESELRHEQEQLEQLIREINPDWTKNNLDNFDSSIAARKKVENFSLRLNQAEKALSDAETFYYTIERALSKALEKHKNAFLKFQDVSKLSPLSGEELNKRRSSIQALQKIFLKRGELSHEIRHKEERLVDKQEELNRFNMSAHALKKAAIISAILSILISGFFFLSDRWTEAVVIGGICLVAATGFIIFSRKFDFRVGSDIRTYQSPAGVVKKQIDLIETALVAGREKVLRFDTKISLHVKDMNLHKSIEVNDLSILKKSVEENIRILEHKNRLAKDTQNLKADTTLLENDLNDAEKKVNLCRESLRNAKNDWKEHLEKINLDNELAPFLATVIFSKIETCRGQLNGINVLKNRIREMEKTQNNYLALAKNVSCLAEFCKNSVEDFLSEIDSFFSKLKRRQKEQEKYRFARQIFKEKHKFRKDAQKTFEKARDVNSKAAKLQLKELYSWQKWLVEQGLPDDLSPETALEALDKISDLVKKINERDRLESEIKTFESETNSYKKTAEKTLSELGRTLPDAEKIAVVVDGLVSELDENKGNLREKKSIKSQIKKCESQLKSLQTKITQHRQRITELLQESGAKSEKEFREIGRLFLERKKLLYEIVQTEKNMRRISGESDIYALRKKLDPLAFEEIHAKIKELTLRADDIDHDLEELIKIRAELKQGIEVMKSADDIARLRANEERLLAGIQQDVLDWACYAMAKYLIEKARERFEKEQQPRVIRSAGLFFKKITNSLYTELFAPIGKDTVEVITSGKIKRKPEQLSRGAAEQLYLAIRFGYIRNRTEKSESLPVIMDDILVNFDSIRRSNAAEAILELSKEQQVLFFTCHPATIDAFKKIDERIPLYALENGHIRNGV